MKLPLSAIKKSIPLIKKVGFAAGFVSALKPDTAPEVTAITSETSFCADADRVHFLNTARTDCILIQSGGRFALVDCSDEMHAHTVSEYLHKVAADETGVVQLDFLAVTHAHEGHIGGLKQLLSDEKINVDKIYIKTLFDKKLSDIERQLHNSTQLINDAVDAAKKRGVAVVKEIPSAYFDFGAFRLRFVNTEPDNYHIDIGENDNSLGLLISKGDRKLLLTGDMVNDTGDIARLANLLGRVDVLQLPRHGEAALSKDILGAFSPKIMIATNSSADIPSQNIGEILLNCNATVYSTVENEGIIVTFTDSGELCLTNRLVTETSDFV